MPAHLANAVTDIAPGGSMGVCTYNKVNLQKRGVNASGMWKLADIVSEGVGTDAVDGLGVERLARRPVVRAPVKRRFPRTVRKKTAKLIGKNTYFIARLWSREP